MAGTVTTSKGLASGTDWSSLITSIINAQKASTVTRLETKVTAYKNGLTAWQSFNNVLLTLNNYIDDNNLGEDIGYKSYGCTLTSSNTAVNPSDVLSATIGDSASKGQYSIEVTQLAQAEKVSSAAFTSRSATPLSSNGGGNIIINGKTVSLSADDTLAAIASKINDASAGVTATVLTVSSSDCRLLIESDTGGTAGISLTDGNNVLETLGVLDSGVKNTLKSGQDASITIDNTFTVTSSSNVIKDAIGGVTLNLVGTNVGSTINLKIAQDNSAVSSKVSKLVDNINSVLSYVSSQNSSSSASSQPLKGDANLFMVRDNISSAIFATVTGNNTYKTATSIGITFGSDGKLSLDSNTFTTALTANPTEVDNVLKSISSTLYDKLNTYADPYTGTFKTIQQNIQSSIDHANDTIDTLNEKYDREQKVLEERYNALEVLISSSTSTSSWPTKQTALMTKSSS